MSTLAGQHCEAGDEIARDIELPADVLPRRHAGCVLHRCLPPQNGVTLQYSRPTTFGNDQEWSGPYTSPPLNDR